MGKFEAMNGIIRRHSWDVSRPLMGHFEDISGKIPGQ